MRGAIVASSGCSRSVSLACSWHHTPTSIRAAVGTRTRGWIWSAPWSKTTASASTASTGTPATRRSLQVTTTPTKRPACRCAALPAYALLRTFLASSLDDHTFLIVSSYVVTVLTVGVAGAFLAVLVFFTARKLGASRRGATIAAMGLGLGSIAFPFSTMLFSHQLTALLLFASFVLLFRCREQYSDRVSVAAGVLAAAAVLTEFPAVVAVALLGAYHAGKDRRARRVLTFCAGALGPALLLGIYLSIAFGGPLRVGYGHLADAGSRAEMLDRGLFGVTFSRARAHGRALDWALSAACSRIRRSCCSGPWASSELSRCCGVSASWPRAPRSSNFR